MAEQALADLVALDIGVDVPGPFCAKLLADYGAEVIKIEDPAGGDPARRAGPFPQDVPHPEKSGLFLHLNTNKKGITLDLKTATGQRIFKELARGADVVVENYPPGTLASWGLSYDELAALNPRLVLTSITPFGQYGPYRDYKATEIVAFAMSARMFVHGRPDREPLRYTPDASWFQAGVTAASATMGAVIASRTYGIGQQVDVSALEAMLGNVDARTLMFEYTKEPATRERLALGYPGGVYPCKDGFLLFAAGQERFFRRLCRAMGREDILQDPRWATAEERQYHKDEFEAEFIPWLLELTRQEAFTICQAGGVMMGPILSMEELPQDPQMIARKYFTEIEHPVAGRLTYPGAPFKMTETPSQVRMPAPLLGQHNEEIYCGRLGYTREDLMRLKAQGVV